MRCQRVLSRSNAQNEENWYRFFYRTRRYLRLHERDVHISNNPQNSKWITNGIIYCAIELLLEWNPVWCQNIGKWKWKRYRHQKKKKIINFDLSVFRLKHVKSFLWFDMRFPICVSVCFFLLFRFNSLSFSNSLSVGQTLVFFGPGASQINVIPFQFRLICGWISNFWCAFWICMDCKILKKRKKNNGVDDDYEFLPNSINYDKIAKYGLMSQRCCHLFW